MFNLFKKQEQIIDKEPIKMYQRLSRLYHIYESIQRTQHEKIQVTFPVDYRTPYYKIHTNLGVRTIGMFDFIDSCELYYYEGQNKLFSVKATKEKCTIWPTLKLGETCDWINLAICEIEDIMEDAYADVKVQEHHHEWEEERLGNM